MAGKRLFAQVRPSATTPQDAYTPQNDNIDHVLQYVHVANTTISTSTFSIYLPQLGTTYDDGTVLFRNIEIDAYSTIQIDMGREGIVIPYGSTLGVRANTANSITFTLHGELQR
jgi:hypothetical protein